MRRPLKGETTYDYMRRLTLGLTDLPIKCKHAHGSHIKGAPFYAHDHCEKCGEHKSTPEDETLKLQYNKQCKSCGDLSGKFSKAEIADMRREAEQ